MAGNKSIGQINKERRANMTEEERQAEDKERAKARRKRGYEKRKFGDMIRAGLEIALNVPEKDEEGNQKLDDHLRPIISKKTIQETGIDLLLRDWVNPDISPKERVTISEFIRDTTEGRPTTKVDLDAKVTTTVEELLEKVQGDSKY